MKVKIFKHGEHGANQRARTRTNGHILSAHFFQVFAVFAVFAVVNFRHALTRVAIAAAGFAAGLTGLLQ